MPSGGTEIHDDAGNMIDDGVFRYVYDAWNRLVKMQSSEDSGGVTIQTSEFDATGRRTVVTNSGDCDATVVYFYDGWKICATRDGAGTMVQQFPLSDRERQLRDLFRLAKAAALEHSLRLDQPEVPRPPCCGRPMNKKGLRSRQLLTPVGVVTWDCRMYQCPQCDSQLIPLDDLLGVPRGQLSPRLADLGMDFVQVESYEQAVEKLERQHGVSVAGRSLVNLAG